MAQSAATDDAQAGPQGPNGTTLDDLEPGEVIRCYNDDYGWRWFYAPVGGGYCWLYHDALDYLPETRDCETVGDVLGDPDVETAIVSRRVLEARQHGARGERDV